MSESTSVLKITVTKDLPNCPQCGSPAIRTGDRNRQCNSCGLVWERMTEEDELDIEADRLVRSRGWAEERGHKKDIGRGMRW